MSCYELTYNNKMLGGCQDVDYVDDCVDIGELFSATADSMEETNQLRRQGEEAVQGNNNIEELTALNEAADSPRYGNTVNSQQHEVLVDAARDEHAKAQEKLKDFAKRTETSEDEGSCDEVPRRVTTRRPYSKPSSKADRKYWERREKNNVAAKRSRDAKRLKETSVLDRWKLLEEKNSRLKTEIFIQEEQIRLFQKENGHIATMY